GCRQHRRAGAGPGRDLRRPAAWPSRSADRIQKPAGDRGSRWECGRTAGCGPRRSGRPQADGSAFEGEAVEDDVVDDDVVDDDVEGVPSEAGVLDFSAEWVAFVARLSDFCAFCRASEG